jgi:hypothetical protein
LIGDLDPKARVKVYWEMSKAYLRQAGEELPGDELRQASEKLWGLAALVVNAATCGREGRRLTDQRELWEYVNKLIDETSDEELGDLWRTAISMHPNLYEEWAPKGEVESALKNIASLLGKLEKLKS